MCTDCAVPIRYCQSNSQPRALRKPGSLRVSQGLCAWWSCLYLHLWLIFSQPAPGVLSGMISNLVPSTCSCQRPSSRLHCRLSIQPSWNFLWSMSWRRNGGGTTKDKPLHLWEAIQEATSSSWMVALTFASPWSLSSCTGSGCWNETPPTTGASSWWSLCLLAAASLLGCYQLAIWSSVARRCSQIRISLWH